MSAGTMFAELAVPQAVAELAARSLGSDEDREAWLQARTGCITATEAKQLIHAGTATARKRVVADLIDEKLNGSKFAGNHFTEWGKLREPVILDELERRFGIRGCGLLVHAEGNSQHAATPDGAGVDFDEQLVLAEIKTSKNDVRPGTPKFERAGYYFQMQWQMYCTGARRVLYVVEQHNDDWSGWDLTDRSTWLLATGPKPAPIWTGWIERDDSVIAEMIRYADGALAELDMARAAISDAGEEPAVGDADVAEIARLRGRVLVARKSEAAAKAEKEAAWKGLLELGAKLGDFTDAGDDGSVRFVAPVAEQVSVPDAAAAQTAHPKEWTQLERARKRLEDLEGSWAVLQEQHMTTEKRVGKPSLTVTAARAKKSGAKK